MNSIRMRVDKIIRESNREADMCLGYWNVAQLPGLGEILNVNGDPYRVAEHSWAITNNDPILYAYVRVR